MGTAGEIQCGPLTCLLAGEMKEPGIGPGLGPSVGTGTGSRRGTKEEGKGPLGLGLGPAGGQVGLGLGGPGGGPKKG